MNRNVNLLTLKLYVCPVLATYVVCPDLSSWVYVLLFIFFSLVRNQHHSSYKSSPVQSTYHHSTWISQSLLQHSTEHLVTCYLNPIWTGLFLFVVIVFCFFHSCAWRGALAHPPSAHVSPKSIDQLSTTYVACKASTHVYLSVSHEVASRLNDVTFQKVRHLGSAIFDFKFFQKCRNSSKVDFSKTDI